VRMNALAIDRQLCQFLLHRLLLVETCLPHVEQCRADHQVGHPQIALHEGKGRVAMQRRTDVAGRPGMPIEQHVLPRDQHMVENDQRIDLVEAVGQRVVGRRGARCESGAADELQIRRTQVTDEADCILGKRRVTPVGVGRLGECLIGISGSRLILRTASM
jgi:hypothetical protein